MATTALQRRCFARPSRVSGLLFVAVLSTLAIATRVQAACNLIPVAQTGYPSVLGAVYSPITAPDEQVSIRLGPCDSSAGFDPSPLVNTVTLTFEPPGGAASTDVVLNDLPGFETPVASDCTLPLGRCRVLEFVTPDTTDFVLPDLTVATRGLAGPARITVRDGSNAIVAEVGELSLPRKGSCDLSPEPLFQQLTVLPRGNVFADAASGAEPEILATVDGGGNLLVPFDYYGDAGSSSVLADTPGSPVAVFLEGTAVIPAMNAGDSMTIADALQAALAEGQSSATLVRSFTLDGRPLPPLLRITSDGGLYGTADAVKSALRIAKNLGEGDLYDLSDRLSTGGRGPIVIADFDVAVDDPVPLKSLRASESTVAFVRDEAFELVNLNAVCDPPDPDTVDQVVSVFDADTGYGASPNTGIAVTLELNGAFLAPTVVASGDLTAFLESELGQCGLDNDGDGFSNSNFLRVFDTQTNDLTLGRYDDVAVAPLVNDRSLAISGSKVFFRTPGGFLDFESDGNAGVDGLAGRTDIAVSPDGKNVYVTGANDNAIAVFGRDDIAGTLTFVEAKFDGIAGVDGLAGAGSVSISPDGNSLYVTSVGDDAVAVFDRDPLTGALSFVEAELGGDPYPFFPLLNPKATVVSPDGMHVYVANQFIDREIQIFDRSSFTGELILGFLAYAGLPDLHDVDGLAISADGQNVYAISSQQNALAVLARESFYGGLTLLQTLFDGVGGVDGLDLPSDIIVSPDGGHVYVTSYSDDAVAIFRRDPSTGLLEYVGIENSDTAGVAGLNLAVGIAMSPDGTRVYVATRGDNRGALVFQRNKATGELAFVEGRFNGIGMEGTPLASPDDVVVSPDDAHVYVSGFNDVTALGNDRRLAVFDTAASPSPSLLSAQPAAMHVAVADERAAILTREAVAPADGASACGPTSPPGGCDLNGDGDAADSVAQLYDATVSPPDLINLGVAASRVSISSALVALTVREADEEGATGLSCDGIPIPPGGCDANGDGDPFDDVLAVFEIGKAPPPFNVRVAADAIGADGSMVAFITPEAGENQSSAGGIHCSKTTSPPGGCDLNADGDAADRILRIYDGTRRKIIETGQSAEDFVIGDGFVAFRTNEAAQGPNSLGCEPTVPPGGCSLNGDGLADEHVMQIYDLESGELINTGYAAIPCELPGCEPGAPYKIRKQGDITTVSFLTDELEQAPAGETNGCMSTTPPGGCDLNGDGDGDDIVLTVFSIASRRAQTAGTVIDDATISPVPDDSSTLPTDDVGGGTVVYVEAKESDLDQDVNADGLITDDMVVVIAGDFDEDGSFDDFDTCVATDNRDQLDIDGDGLGDTACDPDPRACPPAPLAGCRLTTLPGKSALTIKDSADDTRDMLKWKWTRGVATTLADLGNPVGGVAAYSTCVYDASVSSQPLLGAAVFPGGDCAGKPCWKSAGKKGYKFKDKAGAQAGITRVKIKAGEDGKAKVLVKGRGSGLADAGLGGAGPPFAPPVTVQLIVNAGARTDCWQADYSTFKQNDSDRFKARSD